MVRFYRVGHRSTERHYGDQLRVSLVGSKDHHRAALNDLGFDEPRKIAVKNHARLRLEGEWHVIFLIKITLCDLEAARSGDRAAAESRE